PAQEESRVWRWALGGINSSMDIAQQTRLIFWVCKCPANNRVNNERRRLAIGFLFDALYRLQEHRMSRFPKFFLVERHRLFPGTTVLFPLANRLSKDFCTEQPIINTLPINGIFIVDSISCQHPSIAVWCPIAVLDAFHSHNTGDLPGIVEPSPNIRNGLQAFQIAAF